MPEGCTPKLGWGEVKMVGAIGFEPTTPCAQGRCATRLRYAPTLKDLRLFSLSFILKAAMQFTQGSPRYSERAPGNSGGPSPQDMALKGHLRLPALSLFSFLSSTWGRADQRASRDSSESGTFCFVG